VQPHCAFRRSCPELDKAPKTIQVGDYGTKALINCRNVLLGHRGSKPGVMTKNAKWALANKANAEKFKKEFGGRIAGFDEALEPSYRISPKIPR